MAELDIIARVRDLTGRGFNSAARNADNLTGSLEGSTRAASKLGPALTAGAAAAGAAIVGFGTAAIGSARDLQQLSNLSGASAESLQVFADIAKASGGTAEDVADAYREMQLRLAEASSLASGPAVDALNLLGLSLADLEGRTADEKFLVLRDAIASVEDPAARLFASEELLGGSAERLSALTSQSAEAFRDQAAAVAESGRVMDDEMVERLAAVSFRFDELTTRVQVFVGEGLLALVDTLGSVGDAFAGAEARSRSFADSLGVTVETYESWGSSADAARVNELLSDTNSILDGQATFLIGAGKTIDDYTAKTTVQQAAIALADRASISYAEALERVQRAQDLGGGYADRLTEAIADQDDALGVAARSLDTVKGGSDAYRLAQELLAEKTIAGRDAQDQFTDSIVDSIRQMREARLAADSLYTALSPLEQAYLAVSPGRGEARGQINRFGSIADLAAAGSSAAARSTPAKVEVTSQPAAQINLLETISDWGDKTHAEATAIAAAQLDTLTALADADGKRSLAETALIAGAQGQVDRLNAMVAATEAVEVAIETSGAATVTTLQALGGLNQGIAGATAGLGFEQAVGAAARYYITQRQGFGGAQSAGEAAITVAEQQSLNQLRGYIEGIFRTFDQELGDFDNLIATVNNRLYGADAQPYQAFRGADPLLFPDGLSGGQRIHGAIHGVDPTGRPLEGRYGPLAGIVPNQEQALADLHAIQDIKRQNEELIAAVKNLDRDQTVTLTIDGATLGTFVVARVNDALAAGETDIIAAIT